MSNRMRDVSRVEEDKTIIISFLLRNITTHVAHYHAADAYTEKNIECLYYGNQTNYLQFLNMHHFFQNIVYEDNIMCIQNLIGIS